jgi:LysM repeat protein
MRRPIVALALALVLPLPALAGQVTVREGETLSEIADRLGVPMSRLMKLNGISDPDLVEAGRVLTVPGSSGSGSSRAATASGGGTVTVKEGETLSQIAERHGMSMQRLMAINGISDPDHVEAGRSLRVSGAAAAATPGGGYRRGASEHVVRPGESLSTIADGYGVPMSRLVSINAISDPDLVQAGTRLKLKGTPAASPAPAAAVTPRPAPKPLAARPTPTARPAAVAQPVAAATPAPKPRPAASFTPAASPATTTAMASRPAGGAGLASTPGTGKPDWRTYGPLQVDWANWQPMGGSMVAPTLNGEGQSLYLAINCTARKINATSQAGQWKTWDDPQADFEQQLVGDLCKARG